MTPKFLKVNSIYQKSFPIIASLVSAMAFAKFLAMGTANILILIFAVLMYPIFSKALTVNNKLIKFISLPGGLFFTAAMFFIRFDNLVNVESMKLYTLCIYLIGFSIFFYNLLIVIYNKILTSEVNRSKPEPRMRAKVLVFFGSMIFILLMWLPYFLMLYPGDITTDSISQLNQAAGNQPLSNHHPIAHTMIIKLLFNLGQFLFNGDDTLSVATYVVGQSIILSASFSYLIVTLYKFRVKTLYIILTLLFFTLPTYHAQYSVVMWKDIWFGAVVIAFSTTLWRLIILKKSNPKKLHLFEYIMLYIMGVGVCLFRSNGLYAFMLLFVFLVLYCIKKKSYIILIESALVLAAALIIKGPVYNSMGVTPPDPIESLSLPAQQIAAVVRDKGVTEEQEKLLSNIVDVSRIPERYTPDISDSIKNLVRETDNQEYLTEHKLEFLKLWIEMGMDFPEVYTIAHINLTRGYWYPDIQYWVYAGEFKYNNFEITKESKLSQKANEKLLEIRELYRKYYYIGLFWSIGAMTWAAIFMMGASFIKRRLSFLLVYLPVFGIILTLFIATPVFAEFRYAYSVFTTIPLLCIVPFFNEDKIIVSAKSSKKKDVSKNISDESQMPLIPVTIEIVDFSQNEIISENISGLSED